MERILKLRKVIPPRLRRPLRKLLRELPVRLRDAPADLFDRHTLPPPHLRFNVAGTSSRDAFMQVGSRAAREIADAVAEPRDVLDFGCGCGRIAAPLAALWPGLLLATTHSPELAYARPDLTNEQRASLARDGFAFAPGPAFNDNSAFHSPEYLRRAWANWFDVVQHRPYGLVGYQDLSVWQTRW